MKTIQWIVQNQTLAGAALGFTGVITTLLWNAHQSRKAEKIKAHQQQVALLAAFYAELAAIQAIIGQALLYITPENFLYAVGKPMDFPPLTSSYMFQPTPKVVYEKNADKLGYLGRKLSTSIVTAYSAVAEFEAVINIITSPLPADLRTRKVSGKDAACGVQFVSDAFDAVGQAIYEIKTSMPRKYRKELIIFPPWETKSFIVKRNENLVAYNQAAAQSAKDS